MEETKEMNLTGMSKEKAIKMAVAEMTKKWEEANINFPKYEEYNRELNILSKILTAIADMGKNKDFLDNPYNPYHNMREIPLKDYREMPWAKNAVTAIIKMKSEVYEMRNKTIIYENIDKVYDALNIAYDFFGIRHLTEEETNKTIGELCDSWYIKK